MRTTAGGVMLLVLVTGCGDPARDAKQLVERNRAAMEPQLKLMEEFAAKIEQKGTSTAQLELPPDVKLKFAGTSASGNALLLHQDDFRPGSSFRLVNSEGAIVLVKARQLLEAPSRDAAKTSEDDIQKFLAVRYVGIIQELNSTRPAPNKDGNTFTPGKVEFRVHFYDLADKKELGGIDCTAETSESVRTRKGSTYSMLESDLKSNAGKVMENALRSYQ